jgi:hypothetical protein
MARSDRSDDLSREYIIHICHDRTFTIRKKGEPVFNGVALPVFSTDTLEQAKSLQMLHCKRNLVEHPDLPGQPWMRFFFPNDPNQNQLIEYHELERVANVLRESAKRMFP